MIRPKKSLGQNFLTDKNIARKIVNALDINSGEKVIEIGSGTGALTGILLEKGADLTAFELDERAVEELKKKFSGEYPDFNIIRGDFRKIDLCSLLADEGRLKVIGNIPYYISSEVFFKLFESAECVFRAVLTVQKEVARRVASGPGSKEYGILSVARELTSGAKIEFDINPGSFYPRPAVTSSVIRLDFYIEQIDKQEYEDVMKIVRAAFNRRRKMLRNSLDSFLLDNFGKSSSAAAEELEEVFPSISEFFRKRPEQISSEEFRKFNLIIRRNL